MDLSGFSTEIPQILASGTNMCELIKVQTAVQAWRDCDRSHTPAVAQRIPVGLLSPEKMPGHLQCVEERALLRPMRDSIDVESYSRHL